MKKILLFTIVLVISLSSSAFSQVELPFEYFHGRWVNGHLAIDSIRQDDSYDWFNLLSYSYTNNKFKIDATTYKLYRLFEKPDNTFRAPEYNAFYRPNNEWEMSISLMPYSQHTNEYYEENYYKRYYYGIKTKYLKNGIAKIKSIHTPYSYRYNGLFDDEYLSFNSSLEYKDVKTSKDFIEIEAKFDNLIYTSGIQFNIVEGLNLYSNLELEYQKSKNSFESRYRLIGEQPRRVINNKNESFTKTFLEIGFIKAINSNIYINSSIKKHLFKQKQYGSEVTNYSDTLIITEPLDYEINLRSLSTEYKLNVAFIARGDFKDDIVINDYNGYYHKMLFKKQFAAEFDLIIEDYNAGRGLKKNDYLLAFNLDYGLSNRFEFGLISNFRFYSDTYNESYYITYQKGIYFDSTYRHEANIGLRLKYRSYEFENNNWDSDLKYDIIYGNMLSFGQIYIELNTTILKFKKTSDENRDLFSIGDLKNNRQEEIVLISDFGLGQRFSISGVLEFKNNYSAERDRIDYLISLQKRIFHRMELSFLYKKLIYTDSKTQNGYHPDPTLIWRFKLLL